MADPIDIEENAKDPKKAAVDGEMAEQHSLSDQIEADQYLLNKKAASKKGLGFRLIKFIPPGTV